MNRRDALRALGAVAGAAGAPKLLSGCGGGGGGGGGGVDGGGEPAIDTFVFLMMENRSYAHYLGSRALLEGLGGDGLRAGMSNPDASGDPVAIWPATEDTLCVIDPPHGWDSSRAQFSGGANDGFVTVHGRGPEPMQYLTREHLPVTHALADAYTSCDRWFSSVMGPTLPNRMYWHAGTSGGARTNDEVLGGAFEDATTIYHRLDAAGVNWAYYYGDLPVLAVLEAGGLELEGRVRRFLWDFVDDAAAGRLPPVCYVDPNFSINDDHPPHHPLLGQQLIAAVYRALATSPQWKRSLLVVTYDEHGGFFDHVPPPTAPDDHAGEGFDQLGFRVPTFAAGPYVKRGHVSSVTYDHTSVLRHLARDFDLAPLTARSRGASDLLDCIDLERLAAGEAADPIDLPAVEIDESSLPDACLRRDGHSRATPDHDIHRFADTDERFRRWDLRGEARDYVYGVGDYLDRRGGGRIRRR